MTTTNKANNKTSNKKMVIGVIVLAVIIALMALAYNAFREKPVQGSKEITIEVVNKAKESTTYELKTDAQFLREAMEEAKEQGLTFETSEGQYGLVVNTVNGETADLNSGSAYWGFYVNDGYCNYGLDTQPVYDGDAFQIVYTIYTAE